MNKKSVQSGFTLVEMIVALAVFAIVAVVAVGALLKITDANKKSQTLATAINNVNYAFESITRELRVGSNYDCVPAGAFILSGGTNNNNATPASCAMTSNNQTQGSAIAFLSSKTDPSASTKNLTYSYYFEPITLSGGTVAWTIAKAQQVNYTDPISCTNPPTSCASYAPIIDPSVIITSYSIQVSAGDVFKNDQPKAFIYISGYVGTTTVAKTYFDLQTTVSERI